MTAPIPIRPARENEAELRKFIVLTYQNRLMKDWDAVWAICGEEGVGKSELAGLIGWYLDLNFGIRRNMIGSPDITQITEKLMRLPKYTPVIVDEAIKVMYKLGWQSRASIMLNTIYSICRAENKLSILCMPKFSNFSNFFRQHRVKVWIQVVERGHALVFIRNPFADFTDDAWNFKENQKLLDKLTENRQYVEVSQDEYVDALRQTKNFAFEFWFNKMPEDLRKEYDAYKEEVRQTLDIEESNSGIVQLYRNATRQAVKVLTTELKLNQRQVSETLEISLFTTNQMLRELGMRKKDKRETENRKTLKEQIQNISPAIDTSEGGDINASEGSFEHTPGGPTLAPGPQPPNL